MALLGVIDTILLRVSNVALEILTSNIKFLRGLRHIPSKRVNESGVSLSSMVKGIANESD